MNPKTTYSPSVLEEATGKDANLFYDREEILAPIISSGDIAWLELRKTLLYDLPTRKEKLYTVEVQ